MQRTPLYEVHREAGAQFVDFSGWEMPIHYGSQLEEHHQVRKHAGIFDVSHMTVVDVEGREVVSFLRYLLANDIQKLKLDGQALYSCFLNETGGVVDDLIVYRMSANVYRLVVNSATREKNLAHLAQYSEAYDVVIRERDDLAVIALQGPAALTIVEKVFDTAAADLITSLRPFKFMVHDGWQIARTGYTGEDGVEIVLPADEAMDCWRRLMEAGASPCGLGARDTLRLEAGLNLYGTDMDESTSPLVSNLAWTIDWKDEARCFIGRDALRQQRAEGMASQLVGLIMETPGMLRNHQAVFLAGKKIGEITSGSFSPTLGHAVALARVPVHLSGEITVERRGAPIPVRVVKLPFVRHGKKAYTLKEKTE